MEIRVCNNCKKELTLDNFHKDKRGNKGLKSVCKECRKKYDKQYAESNLEKTRERHKRYYDENLEVIKEKAHIANQKYYEENSEKMKEYGKKYYKENKVARNKYNNEYARENKELFRLKGQRYNTRKLSLPHTLTNEQWINIKNHFNNTCAYCGKEKPLAMEHFIPLSKMGELTVNNVIPSCKSCNSSKGVNDFDIWYPKYKYYSRKRELEILKFLHYKNNNQQLTFAI